MSKAYKGYKLIKAIAEGEIKHFTKIKSDDGDIFIYDADDSTFYWEKRAGGGRVTIYTLLNHTFELIEDEVNIIEELNKDRIENSSYSYEHHFIEKINEVIQVVNKHTEEIEKRKRSEKVK